MLLGHLFVCFVRVRFFFFSFFSSSWCRGMAAVCDWHSLDFSINYFAITCRTLFCILFIMHVFVFDLQDDLGHVLLRL